MDFTWGTTTRPHAITLDWSLDSNDVSPTDGYIDPFTTWIPSSGPFYTTKADITIDGASGTGNHPDPYTSDWAYVGETANPPVFSGSGQIAVAHWEEPKAIIDAVFAEQLKTEAGGIIQNGLYIKVIHTDRQRISEALIPLTDAEISQDGSQIHISATSITFPWGTWNMDHDIILDWTFDLKTVLSTNGFDDLLGMQTTSGKFYKASADITIHGDIYHSNCAVVGKTENTVSAFVTKLNGNKNDLTITVTEQFSDGTTNAITKTFSINNNAADTYQVGSYKVYVDTKGNDQIRACNIII